MSQENVELTRRAFQAFEDRDLDAPLAIVDDDVGCHAYRSKQEALEVARLRE